MRDPDSGAGTSGRGSKSGEELHSDWLAAPLTSSLAVGVDAMRVRLRLCQGWIR